ncbi:MAG: hypothetical protein P794_07830 [Epsilonproteobacteria bacterium (ex Lamellibrachia satsuma)]|nr:MAG: hypothetical protein P794_07830 [Epsilonproteobacteria bacterium (ex Lamellibrachia satsuma)]
MKEIVEYLQHKNIIFKSLKEITPKELGSRKKIKLYLGIDLNGYYALVMKIEKKSRILRKEAGELMVLHEKMEKYIDSRITKKYIIINAPLCSHAKKILEENGWKVFAALQQSEE